MNSTLTQSATEDAKLADYLVLFKPRVMSLVVFTAAVGMGVAPAALHPVEAFTALLFIAIGAGAAGALNMYYDADIDCVMKRTQKRPIPMGKISPSEVLCLGLWLSVFSVTMLALAANFTAAGLLALTIVFYVCVYTLWLKRSTPYNIVIGGAAGAFPPMIGWAVATGGVGFESILMFLLILAWTPPHSWALALFSTEDYAKVKVPMLPVVHGAKKTRWQIVLYTVLSVICATTLGFTPIGGWIYLIGATIMNALFLYHAVALWRRTEKKAKIDQHAYEKKFFGFSMLYLFVIFTLLIVERIL